MLLNEYTAPPAADESRAFFSLLNLVSDPKASVARVAELHAAAEKAVEAQALAKAAQAELQAARDAHDRAIKSERDAHDAALRAQRQACDQHCTKAMDEVRRAKAEAERLLEQAKTDAATAAALRTDLETRLEKIKQAAA
ncbi:MAG TPA: hypothetical protein VFB02_16465 [Bradyrhizobium sp.]|nr:hypothetical protein [Bradyrhizobium sp.]